MALTTIKTGGLADNSVTDAKVADAITVTGAQTGITSVGTLTAPLTVGVDDTGHDVKFFGATAGSSFLWDESADAVLLTDSTPIKIGDSQDMILYHDGSNSYITNSQGGLKIATETSGIAVTIGHTTSETTIADNLSVTGALTIHGATAKTWESAVKPFHIGGVATIGVDVTNGYTQWYENAYLDASDNYKFIENGRASMVYQGAGTHAFRVSTTSNSGGADQSLSWTDALGINSSGDATFAGNILRSGSGDTTITNHSTGSGDPSFILNSAVANRNGFLHFKDQDSQAGYIKYVHNGDSMNFHTGNSGTADLTLSGNATFSGDVTLGGDTQLETAYTNLQLYMPDNATGLVLANGSSQANARNWGIYTNYSHWGALDFRVSSANGTAVAHTTEVLSLKKDNSATFAGNINLAVDKLINFGDTSGSTDRMLIRKNDNDDGEINVLSNNGLLLRANDTTRIQIHNGGEVTFTNSEVRIRPPSAASSNLNLHANGENDANINFGNQQSGTFWKIQMDYSDSQKLFVLDENGNDGVYMDTNNTSWQSNSDERIKENLVELDGALANLNTLRCVNFNMKHDKNKKRIGLIAQDVYKVYPEATSGSPNSEYSFDESREGNSHEGAMGLAYTELIAPMIKAIQELSTKVSALENA